ncbi:hypothetical protein AXF42_Ash018878 [Apostasia shenzhenica]|uniref:Uncharacterized protein n=1 Tax=Apostasia shenzhenica TaxID=1088818 RepID=A0A2I0B511_9ASPA|nr:hypothetical protein AXF42_Ash018878 [Apostasia shenzhenica]
MLLVSRLARSACPTVLSVGCCSSAMRSGIFCRGPLVQFSALNFFHSLWSRSAERRPYVRPPRLRRPSRLRPMAGPPTIGERRRRRRRSGRPAPLLTHLSPSPSATYGRSPATISAQLTRRPLSDAGDPDAAYDDPTHHF